MMTHAPQSQQQLQNDITSVDLSLSIPSRDMSKNVFHLSANLAFEPEIEKVNRQHRQQSMLSATKMMSLNNFLELWPKTKSDFDL